MIKISIGNNIKMIRKEKKITQSDLAEQMGISRSYLGDLENDRRNPSATTLESLAKKLDVSMSYLLEGKKTIEDVINNIPKEITEMFNSIDLNSLDLEKQLYLGSSLNFMLLFDKDIISNFKAVFQDSITVMAFVTDNIKMEGIENFSFSDEQKKAHIEDHLKFVSEEFNKITELIGRDLYNKLEENK